MFPQDKFLGTESLDQRSTDAGELSRVTVPPLVALPAGVGPILQNGHYQGLLVVPDYILELQREEEK